MPDPGARSGRFTGKVAVVTGGASGISLDTELAESSRVLDVNLSAGERQVPGTAGVSILST